MDPITLSGIFSIGTKLIDKIFPDPEQKAKAQLELLKLQQSGDLDEMKTQLSAIIAEAQSTDPWTSRARPSFLYVVYVLLLWSIPMGVLTIFRPEAAAAFTLGFKAWMSAIPEPVLTLFGVVMTGYVAGRSWEKVRGATK
ncbi:Holin of 3TMs, for gene-transfer release [uncultured Caudovirales phage]|uniref:Holin of 3TMs, for gene-transfer release n=1 Tax=uncultured Caudovirales phage TaxID=2100421 RepID=A0A6J5RZQ2_9CAUD|nr:Holin of 3TMs, for gene-transfer release [uncultured Caudovirales phage]CAB4199906.1 Holin of 3TMs, for gene-transfer release [uncultured Caudovirales phage]